MDIIKTLYEGLLSALTNMSHVYDWFVNTTVRVPILTEITEPPTTPGGYGQIYHEFILTDVSPFVLITTLTAGFITTIFVIKLVKAVLDAIPIA